MTQDEVDRRWMQMALDLARRGQGVVEPNPMVGCVLVRDGQLLGHGWHERFGGPHAEVNAINQAGDKDLRRATAYVTLEPCCHFGKTPPCVDSLIGFGIGRVVAATLDPNPLVSGKGFQRLKESGIQVECGVLEAEATRLNAPFFKRVRERLPWTIAKWAMSLDGKIATASGHSQWISNTASREWVHRLRGRVDCIMVGIGTALADDPLLTARPPGARVAQRAILDTHLRLPETSRLVATAKEVPVILFAGPEASEARQHRLEALGCVVVRCLHSSRRERLVEAMGYLSQTRDVTNLLVEGGGEVLGCCLEAGLIDMCEVFVCPKLIGGQSAPSPIGGLGLDRVDLSPTMELESIQQHGSDLHLSVRCVREMESIQS